MSEKARQIQTFLTEAELSRSYILLIIENSWIRRPSNSSQPFWPKVSLLSKRFNKNSVFSLFLSVSSAVLWFDLTMSIQSQKR